MEEPEWYANWRHDAVHELQDKNGRLEDEFRMGQWERFDYDLNAGTLIFSDRGTSKLLCEIQVAGSTSIEAENWLWAWANDYWPGDSARDSLLVREYGEKHGICELTHECIEPEDDLNALGWALTAVMVRVTGAIGAYRPPDEGGGLFLVIKNASRPS